MEYHRNDCTPPPSNTSASLIVGAYLIATLAVGYLVYKKSSTATQFLHARRALPMAVTAIAFLAANCGALEIVGIVAASAKYGAYAPLLLARRVPAMLFLASW